MSDDTQPERDDDPAEERPGPATMDSPGQILKAARERKGLSVDEMVSQTLLSRATVLALEANDFERLSQPVFVRGYYRKCAKVLGVPEDEIMAAYAEYTGVPGPRPASPGQVDVIPQDVTPSSWRALSVILMVIAVLAVLAGLWWLIPRLGDNLETQGGSAGGFGDSTLSIQDDRSDADEDAEADRDGGPGAETPDTPAGAAPAAPSGEETRLSSAGDADSAPAAGPVGSATEPGATLRLRFNARSWVQVRDASGDRLLDGILPAGSERTVSGRPPYQVALGNAPGVEILLNGEPVAIRNEIRSNNTARFTLAADAGQ